MSKSIKIVLGSKVNRPIKFNITKSFIYYVVILIFTVFITFLGLILPHITSKSQLLLIMILPLSSIGILMIMHPFLGICIFFLYEYLQPAAFFSALENFRLSMLTTVIVFVSWLIRISRHELRIKWTFFNWLYMAFVILVANSTITAVNNYFAFIMFQIIIVDFVIFLLSTSIVNSYKKINLLIWLILLVHFFYAIKGILNNGLVGGPLMGDENDFALALNVMIPFAFFSFTESKKVLEKYFSLVVLAAFVLGVIASMSRGGWVGLVAVIIFCILKSKRKLIGISAVLIIGLAVVQFAPPKYWREIETISDTGESTARTRLEYWRAAWEMYKDYPISGVGAGNGAVRMPEYYVGTRDVVTQWGRTFHGTIPQIMAELGTIGLVLYFLMVVLSLKLLHKLQKRKTLTVSKEIKKTAKSIMGGIIGYFACSAFLSTVYYPQLWTLFALTFILANINKENSFDTGHAGNSLVL